MDKQLNELFTALSELHAAVAEVIETREKKGVTELTPELISAQQTARVTEKKYRWIGEGANLSAAMESAEGDDQG